ncbi:hypothetical protein ABIC03_005218 [Bradyrhizobium sp. RT6a]
MRGRLPNYHATARDAMFHSYKVAFLSDLTGLDMGYGAL